MDPIPSQQRVGRRYTTTLSLKMLRTTKVIHNRNGPTKTTHTSSKTYPYQPTGPFFPIWLVACYFSPSWVHLHFEDKMVEPQICQKLGEPKKDRPRPINLQDFDRKSFCFWSPKKSSYVLSLSLHHPLQKNAELLMTFWCFFFMCFPVEKYKGQIGSYIFVWFGGTNKKWHHDLSQCQHLGKIYLVGHKLLLISWRVIFTWFHFGSSWSPVYRWCWEY